MAQVYRFTDENGQVRLFAEIAPEPAGTFNGGTITGGLTVDATDAATTAVPFEVDGKTGATQDLATFKAGSGNTALEIFQVAGAAAGAGITSFSNNDPVLYLDHEGNAPNADMLTVAPGGSTRSRFNKAGYLMTRLHAAPADADLVAGECAFWFDQTDGVGNTKLMVKGKSADGTVKTATILLA